MGRDVQLHVLGPTSAGINTDVFALRSNRVELLVRVSLPYDDGLILRSAVRFFGRQIARAISSVAECSGVRRSTAERRG